jgi:hypothetical protein
MLVDLLQGVIDIFADIGEGIIDLLPGSPFQHFNEIAISDDILGFFAWLVPFPQIISLFNAWLAAIIVYYASKVILRWVKILG